MSMLFILVVLSLVVLILYGGGIDAFLRIFNRSCRRQLRLRGRLLVGKDKLSKKVTVS